MLTTDFKPSLLPKLYNSFKAQGYAFITFEEYLLNKDSKKFVILRHDVEKHYHNALTMATLQHRMGIKGTYFFRMSAYYDEVVIRKIAELGHETGYHYDDLSKCHGDFKKAIKRFESNLRKLRDITEIKTISMDGSPRSKFDNRRLWETYDYSDFGIIGEPYFDVDYTKVGYLTDTGRRWNGREVSVRDKVKDGISVQGIKHTKDIINFADEGKLPDKLLITFHPQRWTDNKLMWIRELIWQNLKNQVKWVMVKNRSIN
jgi:hypothetical protein